MTPGRDPVLEGIWSTGLGAEGDRVAANRWIAWVKRYRDLAQPWWPNVPLAFLALAWPWFVAVLVLGALLAGAILLGGRSPLSEVMVGEGSASAVTSVRAGVFPVTGEGIVFPLDAEKRVCAVGGRDCLSLAPRTISLRRGLPSTVTTAAPQESPAAPVYSCADIEAAALAQGFSEAQAGVLAGIGMAESRGRSDALAVTPYERSVGVLQVNTLVHRYSDECLRSLACAVAVAWRLSAGGTTWRPWAAHSSGAWEGKCT